MALETSGRKSTQSLSMFGRYDDLSPKLETFDLNWPQNFKILTCLANFCESFLFTPVQIIKKNGKKLSVIKLQGFVIGKASKYQAWSGNCVAKNSGIPATEWHMVTIDRQNLLLSIENNSQK